MVSPKGSSSKGIVRLNIKIKHETELGEMTVKVQVFHFVFQNCGPVKCWGSLREGNRDHLLNQARSELMKQEHQVGSFNSCINELQQETYAQRLELQDAHHGFFSISKRTITPARRIIYEGKSASRYSNPNYARNGRNEERSRIMGFSFKKLRERHETIQKLTSQVPELQEENELFA